MTECITDFHVSTISPVSIDRFSPNFCHWCILGHRQPYYVFGSKGQSSRSHHRGYRRVQLFLISVFYFSFVSHVRVSEIKLNQICFVSVLFQFHFTCASGLRLGPEWRTFWGCGSWIFHRTDALPVIQPTAPKH